MSEIKWFNRINREWVNAFILTLLILGVLMTLFGVYRFVDGTLRLQDNLAYQIRSNDESINPESTGAARGLIASDRERRDLVRQRFDAMIMGGAGLVVLAIGWIALDIARGHRKKAEVAVSDQDA